MKQILTSIALAAALICGATNVQAQSKTGDTHGQTFTVQNPMDVATFTKAMANTDKMENVQVRGTITQVCQMAGCWVKLKNDKGEDVFVKFPEHAKVHGFTIPKGDAGMTVVVNGVATRTVTSVEDQRHFAEDAGVAGADLDKITEPKVELRIDATGIVFE